MYIGKKFENKAGSLSITPMIGVVYDQDMQALAFNAYTVAEPGNFKFFILREIISGDVNQVESKITFSDPYYYHWGYYVWYPHDNIGIGLGSQMDIDGSEINLDLGPFFMADIGNSGFYATGSFYIYSTSQAFNGPLGLNLGIGWMK